MSIFDRLSRMVAGEEPEGAAAPPREGWWRSNRRLILLALAILLLPLAYAVMSNIIVLTPPTGTEVTPPAPPPPQLQVSVSPSPPVWGASVPAGQWTNISVSINNQLNQGVYLKLKFRFNTTANPSWVSVVFNGNVGPDQTVAVGDTVYVLRWVGTASTTPLRIMFNQSGVKLVEASLWLDTSGSIP